MRNRVIIISFTLCSVMAATSCTRSTTEELVVDEDAADSVKVEGERKIDSGIVPMQEMPDVKISPDAEIPSDKDIADVKIPDVKIDAVGPTDDITNTRIDGMDNTITEP